MEVSSTPPKYPDEKIEYDVSNEQVVFEPETKIIEIEETQFTWRAAIVGSLLGCLVGKENILYFRIFL